jgi:diguanylate cyclase (GGDEF)-like protein
MAERQVPGVRASILLLQEGSLRNVAPNLPGDFAEAIRPRLLSLAAALCVRADSQGRYACCDITSDPEWANYRETALAHGIRGCWAAPVRSSEGDFLGMVVLYLRQPALPGAWGERLLDQAGKLATVAIEHRELAQQLNHRAFHDPLTGLPNRRLFEERLEHAMARARRNKTFVTLLAVDLDRFKAINDSLGHEAGDELLQQFSDRMRSALRETDTVARVESDEFMIVLPDLNDPAAATVVAKKLVETMRAPFQVAGRDLRLTASFGACVYPVDAQDVFTLQHGANAALYRAKTSWGRYATAADIEGSAVPEALPIPAPSAPDAADAPAPPAPPARGLFVG